MTDRRDALLKAKLRALVRTRWANQLDRARDGSLPGGAAMVSGTEAWALAEDDPARSLGPAIAWARKSSAEHLHLLATADAGTLARRAQRFSFPVTVWRVDGVNVAEATPEPLAPEPPLDPRADAFRGLFERAGTEPVVEDGVLRAEVLGLEVARIVGDAEGDGLHLEVGVGRYDRAMNLETRGTAQGMDALFEVVRAVAEQRRPDGGGHDAYHLAPERWLRAIVVRRPELVGAARLEPAPTPVARADLRRSVPAPARGESTDGEPLLVVCAVGLDLDMVSVAADAWVADGREPKLTLCVPVSDAYPAVRDLASLHVPPATVATVPPSWRSL